jgi:2-isopropylmalate synthase
MPSEILDIFTSKYVNVESKIKLMEVHFTQKDGGIETELTLGLNGVMKVYHGKGNGRLDAISNALKRHGILEYKILDYKEHSLTVGSNSQACAYVQLQLNDGRIVWGAGIHSDIIDASARALFSAVNRSL